MTKRRFWFVASPAILWGLYALAILCYGIVRSFGDQVLPAYDIEPLERALFAGVSPVEWLQDNLYARDLVWLDEAGFALHFGWFWLPLAFGLLVTLFERRRLMEYLGWIVAASFFADIGFLLFPVEPPWMVAGATRVLEVRAFVDYTGLDNNPVAAFPSLHAGIPAVIAVFFLVRCTRLRWLAWPAALYSVLVGFAVVYLGEHWALDVIAGWALSLVTWYAFAGRFGFRALDKLPGRPVTRLAELNEWLSSRDPDAAPAEVGDAEERIAA